jgi:hypothetical protein
MADVVTGGDEKVGPHLSHAVKGGDEKVPITGDKAKKQKMYVIGALAVIAILVFFFVRKSNGSAATTTSATPTDTSNEDSEIASLLSSMAGSGGGFTDGLGDFGDGASGVAGPVGATGPQGPIGTVGKTGPSGNGLIQLTYAQAQKLAGKSGSSALYYSGKNTGGVVQGKYANDSKVTYYTTAPNAIKVGAKVPT